MASIKKIEAKRWVKCVCCGGNTVTCEKYWQVYNDNGKQRRGERYCVHCESYAYANNEDIRDGGDDGEAGLRQREDYAAYRAAGCTQEYWTDRDAGYCN